MTEDSGILYIAFGDSFTKEGLMSYRSLRRHMPEVKVCFMTDREDLLREHSDVDTNLIVKLIQPKHIRSKVDFVSETPFKKTLYLDSDTVVVRDLSDVFESLGRFDVALTHDFARKRKKYADVIPEYAKIPYAFSEVNGGVFGYVMNDRTKKFLELWKFYFYRYYQVTNGWDQVSLRISLWESEVHLYHMPVEFNIRSKAVREKQDRFKHEYGEQHMAPRIYHMHYDPEVHRNVFRMQDLEELEAAVRQKAIEY